MGKAYANKKKKSERPKGDFYGTPISLLWELFKKENKNINKWYDVLEPCCGTGNLSNELINNGFKVTAFDLYNNSHKNIDFLQYKNRHNIIITNPPFSQFDDFVMHSKEIANRIYMIGKTNFFGAYKRNKNGVWKHLKKVYVFNRQVDYRTPYRKDGHFHVGNLITGWFCFDLSWSKKYWHTEIMDIQKYATLGQFKKD